MQIINSHAHLLKKFKSEIKLVGIKSLIEDMKKGKVKKTFIFSSDGQDDDYTINELIDKFGKDKKFEFIYTIKLGEKNLRKQLEDVENYFKRDLIKGIKVLLGYFRIMPTDRKLRSFFKLCERYNFPVIFHTGDTYDSPKSEVKYAHPLNIDDLATENPNLKIIMAHIGIPWIMDAAEVMYKNKNVYGDLSGFFVGFSDKRYVSLIRKKVNELIDYTGGDKLLFGTDFPLADSFNYVKFVKSLALTKKELEFVFYKNAEKLFKVS